MEANNIQNSNFNSRTVSHHNMQHSRRENCSLPASSVPTPAFLKWILHLLLPHISPSSTSPLLFPQPAGCWCPHRGRTQTPLQAKAVHEECPSPRGAASSGKCQRKAAPDISLLGLQHSPRNLNINIAGNSFLTQRRNQWSRILQWKKCDVLWNILHRTHSSKPSFLSLLENYSLCFWIIRWRNKNQHLCDDWEISLQCTKWKFITGIMQQQRKQMYRLG